MKTGMWKNNYDIIRSLTRTVEQTKVVEPYLDELMEHFKTLNLVKEECASQIITNLGRVFADKMIDIAVQIVNDIDVNLKEKDCQIQNIMFAGEAVLSIGNHLTNKIQLASKIDEKLVAIRDNYHGEQQVNGIVQDIILSLMK